VAPHGNRLELQLDHGSAELLWASSGTFRYRRVLDGPLPKIAWNEREPVAVETDDSNRAVRLRTHSMEVTIRKQGVLVSVRRPECRLVLEGLSEPESEGAGVVWERRAPAGSEFYGLGPRADLAFGLRGRSVRAEVPLLISTAGYGEFHEGSGGYRFDFTAP